MFKTPLVIHAFSQRLSEESAKYLEQDLETITILSSKKPMLSSLNRWWEITQGLLSLSLKVIITSSVSSYKKDMILLYKIYPVISLQLVGVLIERIYLLSVLYVSTTVLRLRFLLKRKFATHSQMR